MKINGRFKDGTRSYELNAFESSIPPHNKVFVLDGEGYVENLKNLEYLESVLSKSLNVSTVEDITLEVLAASKKDREKALFLLKPFYNTSSVVAHTKEASKLVKCGEPFLRKVRERVNKQNGYNYTTSVGEFESLEGYVLNTSKRISKNMMLKEEVKKEDVWSYMLGDKLEEFTDLVFEMQRFGKKAMGISFSKPKNFGEGCVISPLNLGGLESGKRLSCSPYFVSQRDLTGYIMLAKEN